ncbi:MAG: antimicrobial resistance protein Mig-14 [Candidatus Accumulibacter sp.]|nr:antimicrobial resistance protein Mig-14 [Accumulibacter sp.]
MLNRLRFWRERGWTEITAADYAEAWARFGGSVVTHPLAVGRLSEMAEIPVRYFGWRAGDELLAAIPAWGRHLALSKAVLKARGKKGLFDLGNAETILPVAPEAAGIPLRHAARYLSALHEAALRGIRRQREQLALARSLDDFSPKFRYNQRRELRLLAEAGGTVRPVGEFSPAEFAAIYTELFARRWGFPATGAARMGDVFERLRDLMTGSVIFLDGAPVAAQVLYRVESPRWISVEFINGGVDPQKRGFSPGSVLSWLNVQAEWENARTRGKPLRYSFGRADREYKNRWCHLSPVFEV